MFDKLNNDECVLDEISVKHDNLLMTELPPFSREKEELELKQKIEAERLRMQQASERLEKEMK